MAGGGKVRFGKYSNYSGGPPGHHCKCRKTYRTRRTNVMSGKYKGRPRGPTGRPRGRPRKYSGGAMAQAQDSFQNGNLF